MKALTFCNPLKQQVLAGVSVFFNKRVKKDVIETFRATVHLLNSISPLGLTFSLFLNKTVLVQNNKLGIY